MFNIFISDQLTLSTTFIGDFADDKALIANNHDSAVASSHIQDHLFLLEKWYKQWGVKIDKTKSVHCTFTLNMKKCPLIILNEQTLLTAQHIRHLGIIIDQHITWSPYLRNKLLSLNNCFHFLCSFLTSNNIKLATTILIYKLFFKSIWTYSIELWSSTKVSSINCIQHFQSKTLYAITKAPFLQLYRQYTHWPNQSTLICFKPVLIQWSCHLPCTRCNKILLQTIQFKSTKPHKSLNKVLRQ